MKWFLRLPTRAKLHMGFGVMIVLLAVVIMTALFSMDSVRRANRFATDLVEVRADLDRQRSQVLEMLMISDRVEIEARQQQVRERANEIDQLMARLTAYAQDRATMLRRMQEMKDLTASYRATRDQLFGLILDDRTDLGPARQLAMSTQDRQFNGVREIALDLGAQSEEEERGTARGATVLLISLGGLGLIVAAAMAVLLNWMIAGRLTAFMQLVERVGRGDLTQTADIASAEAEVSGNELDKLGYFLNQMVAGLRDLTSQTVQVVGDLNASASQILASTQQQAASTKEQAATVQQIAATMQEIHQSGGQVVERARQVAAEAEATSATAQSGLEAVDETNRAMESIRQQVEEVAQTIVALCEKTQVVGEIIVTVNELAEQSNLLSLNASIEAVSAGEQGGRFGVVANEMKNLADQAKQCTVQVRTILGDIQKGINSSVMLTEEAFKRVESGKQQADLTQRTIQQMAQTTEQSVRAFQQIIGATNQQQVGFDQVTQGMEDIRSAASQTAAGTSQLEMAVANVNAVSQQLKAAVGRYQV